MTNEERVRYGRTVDVGPPSVTRVSTRDLRSPHEIPRRDAARRRRLVVPARLRIMAWLVLLLLVALVTVVVVTRNLLVAEAQTDATDALNQEAEEFKQFAAAGGRPGDRRALRERR